MGLGVMRGKGLILMGSGVPGFEESGELGWDREWDWECWDGLGDSRILRALGTWEWRWGLGLESPWNPRWNPPEIPPRFPMEFPQDSLWNSHSHRAPLAVALPGRLRGAAGVPGFPAGSDGSVRSLPDRGGAGAAPEPGSGSAAPAHPAHPGLRQGGTQAEGEGGFGNGNSRNLGSLGTRGWPWGDPETLGARSSSEFPKFGAFRIWE